MLTGTSCMKKTFAFVVALGFMSLSSFAAESWDLLEYDDASYRMILVKGVTSDGKAATFNVLDGYYPSTVELGYSRRVGARVRAGFHICGSQTAAIFHTWVRDDNNETFLDEEYAPPQQVTLKADDAIRRAALYACGDKSQKVGTVKRPLPKDVFILVCRNDGSGEEETFSVSESTETVNGRKADFTPASIRQFRAAGEGNKFVLEINRYSGSYSVTSKNSNLRIFQGKCVKQEKQQF